MAITVELLDALLSPAPAVAGGPSPRQQAEAHLQSMSVQDRARGLLSLLLLFSSQQQSPNNVGREMMASVLLRRDVANLGGAGETSLLKEMVEPTLALFASAERQCRRQVGHCLAEICASLSILSEQDSNQAVATILSKISPACFDADVESLRLVASLADRAPMPLWRNAQALPNLLSTATRALQNNNSAAAAMEAVCEAVVYVGIAAQAATSGTSQTPSILLGARERAESLQVDPASPVTQLGRSCLVPLLDIIAQSLSIPNSDFLCKCMQHLSHGASSCPSLVAGDVETFACLVRTCMVVACMHSDSTVRLSSLEVLAAICDVGDVKRRRLSASTPEGLQLRNMLLVGEGVPTGSESKGVIRICAELLVNGVDDDVEGWATDPATLVDGGTAWDEDDDAIYAESLLELFLHNVGGGANSLPVVLPLVEMLLSDSQWKHQRAALSILERCLHAAPVTFSQHIPVAMETALRLSTSDSVRVQFQAISLLGALCETDCAPGSPVRQQYGPRILEAASVLVQGCTKVAATACLAIVSYCRGGNRSNLDHSDGDPLVVPYLEPVLNALVTGPLSLAVDAHVDSGVVAVKTRAIGGVACLAEAGGEAFVPFYPLVMPGLIGCAQLQPSATNCHEISVLRGASIEAATIVGQAVGESNRELFVGDAEQIMNLALPLLNDTSALVIPMDQLLAACARIASVMGDSYAPFIPSVLPHLLNRAMEPADVSITDGDESGLEASKRGDFEVDQDEGTESMTVAIPGKGLKKVTINTTKMQEKSLAARAVYEHASALGAAFGPYAESTMEAFMKLINFQYSSDVRSCAAQAASAVFESSCLYHEVSTHPGCAKMQVPQKYLPVLAKSISSQILAEDTGDMEVLFALADSLSDIYYSAFRRLTENERIIVAQFSAEDAHTTVKQLMKAMTDCLNRRSKITQTMEGYNGELTGEDERKEYSEMLQSEQELLTPLVDSVGYTLKFFRERFLPIFEGEVAPVLAPFLGSRGNSDVRARFAAVCLFDDCVEHCGSVAAAKHAPTLAEGIPFGLADENFSGLKAVTLYGIAQIARHAPSEVLAPQAQNIIHQLLMICSVSKEESDDVSVLEYAASALGSLTLFGKAPFSGIKSKENIAKTFIGQLPLREDEDEAKVCHSGFCEIVENKSVDLAKEASTVFRVIGETLVYVSDGEDIASPETCSRFAEILLKMQLEIPADQMHQAFAAVSLEARNAIGAIMEQHALCRTSAKLVTP